MKYRGKLLRQFFILFLLVLMLLTMVVAAHALSIVSPKTAAEMADILLDDSVSVSNENYGGDPAATGSFSDGLVPVGFDSGIILSSGRTVDAVGPNASDGTTTGFSTPGDPDLDVLIPGYATNDAAVLEFDFECPTGVGEDDVISFRYVFGSEEYNEWVNSSFNDVFGFFLNGTNIALLPDGVTPVSINNVNLTTNPAYYINNDLDDGGGSVDIEADGLTVVLGAEAPINPGVNHMKIAVADAGDTAFDSWVFIEEGSFSCAPLVEPEPANINGFLNLDNVDTSLDPTAAPNAPKGVYTINSTFSNVGSDPITDIYFEVAQLGGGNVLLNADGGPGSAGAMLTVDPAALGPDGVLDPNESFTVDFEIGLARRRGFTFYVDAYGTVVSGTPQFLSSKTGVERLSSPDRDGLRSSPAAKGKSTSFEFGFSSRQLQRAAK